MLLITGNSAIVTVTISRLVKPKSNQNPITGTSARVGTHCSTTAYGYSDSSTQRAWLIAMPIAIPSTVAIARPISATAVDSASASSRT